MGIRAHTDLTDLTEFFFDGVKSHGCFPWMMGLIGPMCPKGLLWVCEVELKNNGADFILF